MNSCGAQYDVLSCFRRFLGFRVAVEGLKGLGFVLEKQMDKKVESETGTGAMVIITNLRYHNEEAIFFY